MDIEHTDANLFDMPPLTWRVIESDGVLLPVLRDPSGHHARLDSWSIADDGSVTPSVECLMEGCGFHEFVRLLDWKPRHATSKGVIAVQLADNETEEA